VGVCLAVWASKNDPFTNYRILEGAIGLTKNLRSLVVYSGLLGVFLHKHDDVRQWYHPSLDAAANWLSVNNNYIKAYKLLIFNQNVSDRQNVFPSAEYEQLQGHKHVTHPINGSEIIVPSFDLILKYMTKIIIICDYLLDLLLWKMVLSFQLEQMSHVLKLWLFQIFSHMVDIIISVSLQMMVLTMEHMESILRKDCFVQMVVFVYIYNGRYGHI